MGRMITLLLFGMLMACGKGASQTTYNMNTTTDKEQIAALYEKMYKALIDKDEAVLNDVHAEDFVLVHMTGLRQQKAAYIKAILDGTLNYFSATTEQLDCKVQGTNAQLTGRSRVLAAVFGGGKHTWPLQLQFSLRKVDGKWRFTKAQASVY